MFNFGPYHSLRRHCLWVCGCDSTQIASKSSWTGTKWTRRTIRTPQPRRETPHSTGKPAAPRCRLRGLSMDAAPTCTTRHETTPHHTTRQAASGPHFETAIPNTNNHQRKRLAAFLTLTKQPSNTRHCSTSTNFRIQRAEIIRKHSTEQRNPG